MTTKKAAWVSGCKPLGYTLNVSASRARAFASLDLTVFDNFRAAQTVANWIKAAVQKPRVKREPARTVCRCPYCGSDDVAGDAAARWNGTDWEVSNVFDDVTCQVCSREFYRFDATWERAK